MTPAYSAVTGALTMAVRQGSAVASFIEIDRQAAMPIYRRMEEAFRAAILSHELRPRVWRAGIDCLPLSMYCDNQPLDDGLMLGFSCAPENEIPKNVETLVRALEDAH